MGFNGSIVVVIVFVAGRSRVTRRARVRTSVYHRDLSGRGKDFCSLVMAYHSRPPVAADVLSFFLPREDAQRQPA